MTILTVDHLSKRYIIGSKQRRELWALHDVSFSVQRGEILGIIGPNGAGKTALLKVLSRVTPPTEGRVVGHGRVVPLLALGAGFQPDLSGRENIFLNAAMYGMAASDVQTRLDDIIEFAGIGDFIETPVRRYSSGMYLRLAFSVAINMDPDLLLADEVLAVGDIEFQERCLERVKQAGQSGMSVLFVSHDMGAISRLCDRVLWLNAGEIKRLGDSDEVVNEYQNSAWATTGRKLTDTRKGSHRNQKGEILSVTLTSRDGREMGALRAADEALVRIVMNVAEAGLDVRFVLHVHARGILVFIARSERQTVSTAGRYRAVVTIPAHLLAETVYAISVEAILFGNEEKYPLAAYNALSFQVFDPASGRHDVRPGVVAPSLEWELTSVAAEAPAETPSSAAG